MAFPRVNTCCFKFDLETSSCCALGFIVRHISTIHYHQCALGFISQINEQPFAFIFIIVLAIGAYFATIYGIIRKQSYYIYLGLIWKGCEMIILTFVPVIEYFYDNEKFENPFSQAFIIAYALNAYYWIVMYSLYKEIQEGEHNEIVQSNSIQPNDIQQPTYTTNNTINYNIERLLVIVPPNNRAYTYQNIP